MLLPRSRPNKHCRILELGIGLSCACLPSVNLLFERWLSSHDWPSSIRHSEKTSSPDVSGWTASNCWSSIKTNLVMSTIRTSTYRGDYESRISRRRSNASDMEVGMQLDTVIFNNRLDVPSIGSRTDDRSQSSRCGDHRGLEDREFEAQLDDTDSSKQGSDTFWRRKDSVMAIDSG